MKAFIAVASVIAAAAPPPHAMLSCALSRPLYHRRHPVLQVFVPRAQDEADEFSLHHTAPVRLMYIAVTLLLGWPMYLIANVSGRPYDRWANHFDPYSPIFSKRERIEVCLHITIANGSSSSL